MAKSERTELSLNAAGSLIASFRQSLQKKEWHNRSEISIYDGATATGVEMESEVQKLMAAFPEVTNDFLIILIDRLIDNGFTKERVQDAISKTIDTNPYRRPSIADIISYDKKVKLYTYSEVEKKCLPGYSAFQYYERVEIEGKQRFIEK
jgi:hypothetical protein